MKKIIVLLLILALLLTGCSKTQYTIEDVSFSVPDTWSTEGLTQNENVKHMAFYSVTPNYPYMLQFTCTDWGEGVDPDKALAMMKLGFYEICVEELSTFEDIVIDGAPGFRFDGPVDLSDGTGAHEIATVFMSGNYLYYFSSYCFTDYITDEKGYELYNSIIDSIEIS